MQLTVKKDEKIAQRAKVAEALLRWHLGEVDNEWFEDQLKSDPVDRNFRVSRRIKARRFIREGWAWAQLFAILAGFAAALRQVFASTADD
jgi:hypothetical protein